MVYEQRILKIHKTLIILITILIAALFVEWNLYNKGWLRTERHETLRSKKVRMHVYEPAVDLTETKEEYIIKCDLPGIDKEQIGISLRDNYIVISGMREIEKDEKGEYYYRERESGYFYRRVLLPNVIDKEEAFVEYSDGILTIKLPKKTG